MEFDLNMNQLQREIRKLIDFNAYTDINFSAKALFPIFEENEDKRRNLVYYMVLTSDHPCLEELLDDPVIGFLMVNYVPIEMNWTVRVLCHLRMQVYILEIIEYGPVGVTSKLLKELTSVSNEVSLCGIAFAVACKIIKLLNNKQKEAASTIKTYLFTSISAIEKLACDTVMKATLPSYAEFGIQLLEFLSQLHHFITLSYSEFNEKSEIEILYSIGGEYEKEPIQSSKLEIPDQVVNLVLKCLEDMLKLVSCEIWISWAENSDLQNKIGTKIYAVVELFIEYDVTVSETFYECFHQMIIKPPTEEDEIEGANLSQLIDKVYEEKSEIIDKWYTALCERRETWKNPDTACLVLSKIRLAQNRRDIILNSLEFLLSSKDESLREAFFVALQSSECSLRVEIFEKVTENNLVEHFYSNESKPRITTAFNKLSANFDQSDIHDLITLFLECPTCVLRNVFQLAASSKENHSLCKRILEILKPALNITSFVDDETAEKIMNVNIFNHVYGRILNASHADKEWNNLVDFLKMDFERPSTFSADCLISTLEDKLSKQDWKKSKYVTMMLGSIIHQEIAGNSLEVLIAFIAQVLGICSWDATTFDASKAQVNKICCDIVSGIKLLELDSVWLRRILSHLPNYIQTHFCDLWFEDGRIYPKPSKPFLCLLIAARTKSIQVQSAMRQLFLCGGRASLEHRIFAALFKILPIVHAEEWPRIFEFCCGFDTDEGNVKFKSFKIFSRAVTAFSTCWDQDTASCVEYCVQNLSTLFQTIVEDDWSLDDRISIFRLLLRPLESMPASAKDSCYFLMLPVMLKCVKIRGGNEDGDVLLPFLNSIDETWRDKFQEALKTQRNANSTVES